MRVEEKNHGVCSLFETFSVERSRFFAGSSLSLSFRFVDLTPVVAFYWLMVLLFLPPTLCIG